MKSDAVFLKADLLPQIQAPLQTESNTLLLVCDNHTLMIFSILLYISLFLEQYFS